MGANLDTKRSLNLRTERCLLPLGVTEPLYILYNIYIYDTQRRVVAALEFRGRSAVRGRFIDPRWTFSFSSSATVPACLHLDLNRGGGPARWSTRGLSRGRSERRSMSNCRDVGLLAWFLTVKTFIWRRREHRHEQGTHTRHPRYDMCAVLHLFIHPLETFRRGNIDDKTTDGYGTGRFVIGGSYYGWCADSLTLLVRGLMAHQNCHCFCRYQSGPKKKRG